MTYPADNDSMSNVSQAATTTERVTMTVPETAKLLGLSESATYEAAARGDLPILKIGRRVLVVRSALMVLIGGSARSESPTTQSLG